jgi:hypothetical protein
MTFDEIQAEICEIETLLRECAPSGSAHFQIRTGRSHVYLHSGYSEDAPRLFDGRDTSFSYGDTPREMLDAAWEVLRSLPDPVQAAHSEWYNSLWDVTGKGHDLALPDDVLEPLRQSLKAMYDNFLTCDKE